MGTYRDRQEKTDRDKRGQTGTDRDNEGQISRDKKRDKSNRD